MTGRRTFVPMCLAAVCVVGMQNSLLCSITLTVVVITGVSGCPNSVALHLARYAKILERHFYYHSTLVIGHSKRWRLNNLLYFSPLALVSCNRQLARLPWIARGMVEYRDHLLRSGPSAPVGYRRVFRPCNRHGEIWHRPSNHLFKRFALRGPFNVFRVVFPLTGMKKRQARVKIFSCGTNPRSQPKLEFMLCQELACRTLTGNFDI